MKLKGTHIKRGDIRLKNEKEGPFIEISEKIVSRMLKAVKDAHIVFLRSPVCSRKNIERAIIGIISLPKYKKTKDRDDLDKYLKKEYRDSKLKALYEKELETIEYSYRIMQFRKKLGLTQKALAKKLGTTQSVISRIEKEGYKPSIKTLEKIARTLGVNVKALIA